MKKSIIKKLFIKLSRLLGYEIIDQTDFSSPTLQKKLNEDLSIINEKSIISYPRTFESLINNFFMMLFFI